MQVEEVAYLSEKNCIRPKIYYRFWDDMIKISGLPEVRKDCLYYPVLFAPWHCPVL